MSIRQIKGPGLAEERMTTATSLVLVILTRLLLKVKDLAVSFGSTASIVDY